MSTQHLPRGLALALALAAVALVACGGTDSGGDPDAGEDRSTAEPPSRPDELAEHEGRPCPRGLPEPGDGGEVVDPASAPPTLEAAGLLQPDEMWVCDYTLAETQAERDRPGGRAEGWLRASAPVPVPADQRDALLEDLGALEPADPKQVCSADLGPRRMLVLSTDGDLTGIVVDDFGCRDVRMTDDPHTAVPGEASAPGTSGGTVPGALTGPEGLADRVAALVR